jgi:hypothetical protein
MVMVATEGGFTAAAGVKHPTRPLSAGGNARGDGSLADRAAGKKKIAAKRRKSTEPSVEQEGMERPCALVG